MYYNVKPKLNWFQYSNAKILVKKQSSWLSIHWSSNLLREGIPTTQQQLLPLICLRMLVSMDYDFDSNHWLQDHLILYIWSVNGKNHLK